MTNEKMALPCALLKKRLIIINFAYSKKGNVGGRRWRHFSTLLAESYEKVFVLTERTKDPIPPQQNSIEVISFYHFLQTIKKINIPIVKGIMYRFSLFISKLFIRGNYFDNSLLVGKQMSKWISKHLHQHQHEASYIIVISMGPFQTALPILSLKKQFPQVVFVLDYRDPWSQNTLAFGIKHLNGKRRAEENGKERRALQLADGILAVDPAVLPKGNLEDLATPYIIIRNGMQWSPETNVTSNEKISLLFAGTFYEDTQDLMEPFLSALKKIQQHEPDLLEWFQWNFIGHIPRSFISGVQDIGISHFNFSSPIDQTAIEEIQRQCDLGINIVHRDFCYSMNSKFLETLGARKKTLYIGWPGSTTRFIEENEIGFVWNPELDLSQVLRKIKWSKENNQLMVTPNHTLNELTFEEQSKKLKAFLNDLARH